MADKRTKKILALLDERFGVDCKCYLNYETADQLLVATILSAQCTDERVNKVTETLFKKYPDIYAFAAADANELERDIHSVGFFRSKAANIISCAKTICEKFEGHVPSSVYDLTSLAGVGRKTANVIRGNIYHEPSIVVDTHVNRVSNRLGFVKTKDPVKVEFELMKVLPKDHWILYNIQIIAFGRSVCTARNPACGSCFLSECCEKNGINERKEKHK